jgi:hypothetical protein
MLGADGPEQNSPIPLEEAHLTVLRILRILHGERTGRMSPIDCANVLDAADKYDFFHVPNYIGHHHPDIILVDEGNSWETLKIAARINNESLAKVAIGSLIFTEWPAEWDPHVAQEIGMAYFCAILRAANGRSFPGSASSRPPWTQIAASFRVIT